jgi:hypothetical protein
MARPGARPEAAHCLCCIRGKLSVAADLTPLEGQRIVRGSSARTTS